MTANSNQIIENTVVYAHMAWSLSPSIAASPHIPLARRIRTLLAEYPDGLTTAQAATLLGAKRRKVGATLAMLKSTGKVTSCPVGPTINKSIHPAHRWKLKVER